MTLITDPSYILKGIFSDHSIELLRQIFQQANDKQNNETLLLLKNHLISVLKAEETVIWGIVDWKLSPSGDNHIICTHTHCFFINIYGMMVLFENWLLGDGELFIMHCHWIEKDNLVVFHKYYIVHNKKQTVICHYSNDTDAFVYSGVIEKINRDESHYFWGSDDDMHRFDHDMFTNNKNKDG